LLCEVRGTRLEVTGTDGEVTIRTTLDVEVLEPGRTVVPAKLAAEAVRKLPAGAVTMSAEDGEVGERFGSSVSLGGKRILLGAPGDDDRGQISGSAYLYRLDLGEVVLDDDFEP
jgi:hypothetical protein